MTITEPIELSALPSLPSLGRRERQTLHQHVDRLTLTPGTVLAHEGHHARQLVVLLTGSAVVTRDGAVVDRLGPDDRVGAPQVLDGDRHQVTVTAETPIEALVVNGPTVRWLAQEAPEAAAWLH
jgi:CRP-like cAMP-binding protein